MKNKFAPILTIICAFILIAGTVSAQQSTQNQVFEFTVTGLLKQSDATLLDSAMMKKKGIYASKTDFATKKITVTCASFMEFKMLNAVIVNKGFEADGKDLVIKKQDQ